MFETYASATALVNHAKKVAKEKLDCEIMKLCKGDIDKINDRTLFIVKDDVAKSVIPK